MIQIQESEPQVLNSNEHYFITRSEKDDPDQITKSNSTLKMKNVSPLAEVNRRKTTCDQKGEVNIEWVTYYKGFYFIHIFI